MSKMNRVNGIEGDNSTSLSDHLSSPSNNTIAVLANGNEGMLHSGQPDNYCVSTSSAEDKLDTRCCTQMDCELKSDACCARD